MHYALPHKKQYPIETEEQLKTAELYVKKYISNFHPAERVVLAGQIEKRASELKVALNSDWVSNYSKKGDSYSPDFDLHMDMRKQACAGKKILVNGKQIETEDLLDKVAAKKGEISAKEMVDLVSSFDKRAGLEASYDRKIRDPFFTVYGSSTNPNYGLKKVAADTTIKDLEDAVYRESFINKLATSFGQDFADNFKQDPENIFSSMPAPEKAIILEHERESRDE